MRIRVSVACLAMPTLLLACSAVLSRADAAGQFSEKELHRLVKEAHTTEQYRQLAEYCREQATRFHSLAVQEQHEILRLEQSSLSFPHKYPTALDSAEHLYQYYSLKAGEMGQFAAEFQEKLSPKSANAVGEGK